MHTIRTHLCAAALTAACALSSLHAHAQDFPDAPIRLVVGSGTGGSFDRLARAMAPHLSEQLGQPVVVENRPGAATHVGHVYFLQQPADGYTVMVTAPNVLATNIQTGVADYTIDDLAFINTQWGDWDLVFGGADSSYDDVADLLQDIRDRPGQVSVAVISKTSGEVTLRLLLEAAGLSIESVRLVTYDDGNELRTAMAGGHMDFSITAGDSTLSILDLVTPLAVVRRERHPDWDVPTLNEAVSEVLGTDIPVIDGTLRSFAVHAALPGQHPDRWEKLVKAFQDVLADDASVARLREQGIGTDWLGPERTQELAVEYFDLSETFSHLLN